MADMIESRIICPYLKMVKKQKIICETTADGAVSVSLHFPGNAVRNEYIRSFCASGCWKGCPLAQFNEENYC